MLWLLACTEIGVRDRDSEVQAPVAVEERFTQAPLPALDVLFVVDGTGSMAEEQTGLSAAADHFLTTLSGLALDWQVGVVSMDLSGGGALRGEPWILTPVSESPVSSLAASLQVGTEELPPAAGFAVALTALSNPANRGFRRSTAALHLIFVSDGDDQSGMVAVDGVEVEAEAALRAWMAGEEAATGHAVRASAVVGDVPEGCSGAGGRAAPGSAFAALALSVGGAVRSICSPDYGAIAEDVGAVGVEWQRVFVLQAMPEPGSVRVEVDGARAAGWILSGQELIFDPAPPAGAVIVVRYNLT